MRLEDTVWIDPRFVALGKMMGVSRFDAIARVAFLWSHCTEKQIYSLKASTIDLLADFENFSQLLLHPDVDLAEQHEDGFRIRGTKGRIEWLKKLRNNSTKGGKKTRAKWQAKRLAKEGPDGVVLAVNSEGPLTLTPTLIPAPVPTPVPVPTKKQEREEKSTANTGVFIGTYCRLWKEKYGTNPAILGKEAGAAKSLVKTLGSERAAELVESYLGMNDAWFLKKRHDLTTFVGNLNAVVQFHDTGTQIHGSQAHEIERSEANADTWDRAAQILNERRRKTNEAV